MHFDLTVTMSVLLSLVVTIAGSAFNWLKARKDTESAQKRRREDLKNISDQIKALKDQANALKLQADLEIKRETIPRWELTNNNGIIYAVSNLNSYKAKNVEVSSPIKTYKLGDIEAGSQKTFNFIESSLMDDFSNVAIRWKDQEEESHTLTMAVPAKQ